MDMMAEMQVCKWTSDVLWLLEKLRTQLPARTAKIEREGPSLASPYRETYEFMAKKEKILLFCAIELRKLDDECPRIVREVINRGPIQIIRKPGSCS